MAAPPFVRVGLLSTGQGVWGTVAPTITIDTLLQADSRRLLINPRYATEVQRFAESVPTWRKQVVEWLQELAAVFRLDLNTLQTAVSFFDRILSLVYISSKQLQVCGLAALYFATKVLETAPFRAEEIEKYFSQVATPQDVMRAELNMLHLLKWDANAFTPVAYVRHLLQLVPHEGLGRDLQALAEVLSAWAMLDYDLLGHPTSTLGMACVAAACELLGFDASPLVALLHEGGVDVEVDRKLCSRLAEAFRREVDPATLPPRSWPPKASPAASPPPPLLLPEDGEALLLAKGVAACTPRSDSDPCAGDPRNHPSSGLVAPDSPASALHRSNSSGGASSSSGGSGAFAADPCAHAMDDEDDDHEEDDGGEDEGDDEDEDEEDEDAGSFMGDDAASDATVDHGAVPLRVQQSAAAVWAV